MQEAIKTLNRKIQSMKEVRDAWANDKEEDLSDEVADFDNKTAQLKAAIEVLQRKVKKDPRVEGLPELGKQLILWTKSHGAVFGKMVACYQKGVTDKPIYEEEWHWGGTGIGDNYGIFLKTDDILFYCDPDDIV